MKNEKVPEQDEKPETAKTAPEPGADSQLHCYNSVSWRLGELFGADDEPEAPKPEK